MKAQKKYMPTLRMTKRERLLAALRKQEVDRIPWSPLICGYYTLGLSESLKGDDIATQREIGCDILERYALTYRPVADIRTPIVNLRKIDLGTVKIDRVEITNTWIEEVLVRTFDTPVGTLRDRYVTTVSSPWLMFAKERKIKTLDDIRAYHYLIDAQQYYPTYDYYLEVSQEIGDEGIAATDAPYTPFQTLLEIDIGVQNFHYLLHDHPKEMIDLMTKMHQKNLEACQLVADSPAEVVIIYENTSTTYMSPYMFNKYIIDHLNEYTEILHQGEKLVLIHMCGKLQAITEEVGKGCYDGITDIAPPPTGDLELAEAKNKWGERKVVIGGIDATSFVSLKPHELKGLVWNILDQLPDHRGVILGSGDVVPLSTPLENLKAVTEAVKEYGLG